MKAFINATNKFQDYSCETNKNIGSGLLSLEFVVENEIHFNIPIYQRLYVWKYDQIRTLLEDIRNAFLKDTEEFYFLGSIMLSSSGSGKIDLVDGQQRFTTLWLICDALSNVDSDLKALPILTMSLESILQ